MLIAPYSRNAEILLRRRHRLATKDGRGKTFRRCAMDPPTQPLFLTL
jgi:hypothetical protein